MKHQSRLAHQFIMRLFLPGIEVQIGIYDGQTRRIQGCTNISLCPRRNFSLKIGLPFYSVAQSDT